MWAYCRLFCVGVLVSNNIRVSHMWVPGESFSFLIEIESLVEGPGLWMWVWRSKETSAENYKGVCVSQLPSKSTRRSDQVRSP